MTNKGNATRTSTASPLTVCVTAFTKSPREDSREYFVSVAQGQTIHDAVRRHVGPTLVDYSVVWSRPQTDHERSWAAFD